MDNPTLTEGVALVEYFCGRFSLSQETVKELKSQFEHKFHLTAQLHAPGVSGADIENLCREAFYGQMGALE